MVTERMLWLPDVLARAGLNVITVPGWEARGHTDDGDFLPRAVMVHHDGSPYGDSPGALNYLINGFKSSGDDNYDAQVWIDREADVYIIAAGRAQHAGRGTGWGVVGAGEGNRKSLGIETDHTDKEPWVPLQLDAVRIACAAICEFTGWSPRNAVLGHKEYAPGRKSDPDGVNMDSFRNAVLATIPYLGEDDMANTKAEIAAGVDQWMRTRHDIPGGDKAMTPIEFFERGPAIFEELAEIKQALAALTEMKATK
jgi:hypothetical protein